MNIVRYDGVMNSNVGQALPDDMAQMHERCSITRSRHWIVRQSLTYPAVGHGSPPRTGGVSVQHNNGDTAMLARLEDEREFMSTLLDRAQTESTYRSSEDFGHHVANLEGTFFFPLNWLADGNPQSLCEELGFDYRTLSLGTPAQRLALRIQLLDSLLGDYSTNELPDREYDVFISHASEDKDPFVRKLAEELHDLQLRVWYDEFELSVGDSLRRSIDNGIARSKYGVVVLSPAFFAKNWTQYELDGLVSGQVNGNKVILPIWYNVSYDDILGFSPSLADKVALDANELHVEYIAMLINRVVRRRRNRS